MIKSKIFCLIFSIGFLHSSSSLAQYAKLMPLEGWSEEWVDEVPVSGGIRVGLMFEANDTRIDPASITIFLPESDLPLLCVSITSFDGRYSANVQYDVKDRASGPIELFHNTKFKSELSSYKASQIAVLAKLTRNCKDSPDTFVVASWDNHPNMEVVTVLLNSSIPTKIIKTVPEGVPLELPCDSIDEGVVYNLRCDLKSQLISDVSKFYIRRRKGITTLPLIALPIKVP